MRSLQVQDQCWDEVEAPAFSAAASSRPAAAEAPWVPESRWCERNSRFSWTAGAVAIGLNALLLAALVTMNVVPMPSAKRGPTVVKLLEIAKDPPPAAPPPEQKVEAVDPVQPPIVAPKPIIQPPISIAPPMATAPEPPPVRATIVAPAPAKPAVSGPVSVGDLSSKMVSAKPPKYPVESRRKREQGTVVLSVLLSTSGNVSDISVSRSSGFPRLDKAALEAVRRWLWSPTMLNGEAVMVRGIVEIPFVLQG